MICKRGASDEGSCRAASEGGSRRTMETEKTTEQRTKEATKKPIMLINEGVEHLVSKSEGKSESFFITTSAETE